MSITEAAREALNMLNHVEIKGESNIVAMSKAMSWIKGIIESLDKAQEEQHERNDQQG